MVGEVAQFLRLPGWSCVQQSSSHRQAKAGLGRPILDMGQVDTLGGEEKEGCNGGTLGIPFIKDGVNHPRPPQPLLNLFLCLSAVAGGV